MRVFFGQVSVEVELEGSGGASCLQRIVRRDGVAQGAKRDIEALVVDRVRLGDERRDLLDHGEDGVLLPVGVIGQDFVEEPKALHCRFESWRTASSGGRGGVDRSNVGSERVVDRPDPVNRTVHSYPPCGNRFGTLAAPRTPRPFRCSPPPPAGINRLAVYGTPFRLRGTPRFTGINAVVVRDQQLGSHPEYLTIVIPDGEHFLDLTATVRLMTVVENVLNPEPFAEAHRG